jgi:hypothetical protein
MPCKSRSLIFGVHRRRFDGHFQELFGMVQAMLRPERNSIAKCKSVMPITSDAKA